MLKSEKYARDAHRGILYGGEDYADAHLAIVVGLLAQYGITDPDLIDAAWLHDTVEDTTVTEHDIEQDFNTRVARIVRACSGFGENRKARVAAIHSQIVDFADAAIIKAVDRIANVENAKATNPGLYKMYMREMPDFIQVVKGQIPEPMLERLLAA